MAHTARMHSIPNIPIPFLSTDADSKTVSEASEIIDPTTGTTPDRVTFAALMATASALPLTMPLMER